MAERTLPGSLGLTAEWALGADTWKDGMDLNLFVLSITGQLVVKSLVADEPLTPTEGDVHIITASNNIAIYDQAEWKVIVAQEGWLAYSLGDDTLYVLKDGTWEVFVGASQTVPSGGAPGQVLTKTGVGDTDYDWDAPPPGPPGDSIELRQSAGFIQWRQDDDDPTWANLVDLDDITGPPGADGGGVPVGGTIGQVLAKQSGTDGDVDWEDPATGTGVPDGGTTGQVLTKISNDDGDATWADPTGGGGGGSGTAETELVVLRGTEIAENSGASVTVDIPVTAVAGDLAVIMAAGGNNVTLIAGWAACRFQNNVGWNFGIMSKILSSGDIAAGDVQVDMTGSFQNVAAIAVFEGPCGGIRSIDAYDSIDGVGGAGHTPVTVATTGLRSAKDFVIGFISTRANSVNVFDAGTQEENIQTGNGSATLYSFDQDDGALYVEADIGTPGFNTISALITVVGKPLTAGTTESMLIAVGDEDTEITAGVAKITFRMPYAFTLTGIRGSLKVGSTTGDVVVDVNEGGVSLLSTELTIDATEKTSVTSAVPAVISDSTLADDAEITIDIDNAGVDATGLKVTLIGHR